MFIEAYEFKYSYKYWINTDLIERITFFNNDAIALINGTKYIISREDSDKLLRGDRYDT